MTEIFIALIGGVVAGYIGAVSSSGGLLSLPLLLFLNLPAPEAIATNRFAAIGLLSAAIPKFSKANKIKWKLAFTLMPIALVGGIIGSSLVVNVSEDFLNIVVAISLLLVLPVIVFAKKPTDDPKFMAGKKQIIGYFIYFALMIYGGLLGAGMGIFLVLTLFHFFNLKYVNAIATNFAAWLVMSIAAVSIFIYNDLVDYKIGIPLGLGMYVGGQLGAHLAIKKGDKLIRASLIAAVIASILKLLIP